MWGWDEPDREVVVRFESVESRAVADAEGRFEAVLPAMAPSAEGRTLAQAEVGELPGVGVIETMGLGADDDVHPPHKREVARRLAASVPVQAEHSRGE